MSHHLDVDSVVEKLILLQHFAAGSKAYCAERGIGGPSDQGHGEFDDYWGWTKGIVCSYALDCAIKFRVLQDSADGKAAKDKLAQIDAKACSGLKHGLVTRGQFDLSLREISNKIIHSTRVVPDWQASRAKNKRFQFWPGTMVLSGDRYGKGWTVQLNVANWALAMQRFFSDSDTHELYEYVGQDWFPANAP
jgi:hypothetical protein